MISLTEARACIAATARPLPARPVPLREARGRVLREEVRAAHDLPAFDRSAMDGYAVARDDPARRFRVVGEIQPGAAAALTIGPGECVRIFTGGALPPGASQVLMQEDVRREGEWMEPVRRGEELHVRHRGEDVRAGERVLAAGQRLGPAELSLLAFLGEVQPVVSSVPRVLHIATGRELVDPAATPGPGEIRDSNSTLLAALLAEADAELSAQFRCGDESGALAAAISAQDAGAWDLLLISGGASVGDYDFGPSALRELGFKIYFDKINLRPGKPLVFASRGAQLAFVIPGNPVSHFILFHTAIRAALVALEGAPLAWLELRLPLAEAIDEPANPRETFWPARLTAKGVQPLRWQSSGDLTGLVGAQALIRIEPGTKPLATGDPVACVILS